jgi:hypothetical protein
MTRLSATIVSYRRLMTSKSAAALRGSIAGRIAHCTAFVLLAAVGALGLSTENGLNPNLHLAIELRWLFALLLLAFVAARCPWGLEGSSRPVPAVRRGFERRTARVIYLLLYCLVGFQLLLDISTTGQLHTEHCQSYVVCGVLALLLNRILTSLRWRFSNAKRRPRIDH